MEPTAETRSPSTPLPLDRWPSEIPLLIFVIMAAAMLWMFLIFSIFGIVYALLIGLALFLAHVAFVAHLRGSAVRLGPNQFPELHDRVQLLAAKAGIDPVPEAYLMEAGGTLNALATKLFRSRMIVLYSDLLDACGSNSAARDMIIGHELTHIKAGHLRGIWFLALGMFVPFLGGAYSRAREYTCDRYGAALCGDQHGALAGLAILAAGKEHGPKVDLETFARQKSDLDTGWMTLGKWLSTHPPLCERIAALEPSLTAGVVPSVRGPVRALSIIGIAVMIPVVGAGVFFATLLPDLREFMEAAGSVEGYDSDWSPPEIDEATGRAQVEADFDRLSALLAAYHDETGMLPADEEELSELWESRQGGEPLPNDPFYDLPYGYIAMEGGVYLWSSGPDAELETDDDIERWLELGESDSGSS
jgi:Zn-dependent protease with chaperone function